jgi:hypothetical protein
MMDSTSEERKLHTRVHGTYGTDIAMIEVVARIVIDGAPFYEDLMVDLEIFL